MTFAPLNRKFAPRSFGGESTNPSKDAGRTGVTIIARGRAVATIRQGNSLVYLGQGTVEQCVALYDRAKESQARLNRRG